MKLGVRLFHFYRPVVHDTVDIPKASLPGGIILVTPAGALLFRGLYFLKDKGTAFVFDDILFNIGFGMTETVTNQLIHFYS